MPRHPKPFRARGWYISRAGGRYLKLCPVADGMAAARKRLTELLADSPTPVAPVPLIQPAGLSVRELAASFLAVVKAEKDPDTHTDYERWTREFASLFGDKAASAVTRGDAQAFKSHLMTATYPRPDGTRRPYAPKTVNNALIAVRRLFNWGIDTEHLAGANPFARLKLLPAEGRRRVATDDEYRRLLAHATPQFRDVLVFLRHTAARPQDVYTLTWGGVDLAAGVILVHRHKGSRTARVPKPRVFGIPAAVRAVLERRRADRAGDLVFVNRTGRPWTKDALGNAMRKLRRKAGIAADVNGEQFVLYTHRHTFLTRAGADPAISQSTLADIAGHASPATTARYVHAARQQVADAARRIAEGFTPNKRRTKRSE